MSKISNTVTTTVTLGGHGYGSPLTVTQTGAILIAQDGANGIYANVAGGKITNDGTIIAGGGVAITDTATGGIGVDLNAVTTLHNAGLIQGGASYSQAGGAAILLGSGGTVSNTGTVGGGASVFSTQSGGNGLTDLAGSLTLTNAGLINGGTGGAGYTTRGNGGYGITAAGAAVTATNSGTIQGGEGGGFGSSGYFTGGNGGIALTAGTLSLNNSGIIDGGNGQSSTSYYVADKNGGNGGTAVQITAGGMIDNQGQIIGGAGSSLYYGFCGNGGAGVDAQNAVITNGGTIVGGNAGNPEVIKNGYGPYASGATGGDGVLIASSMLVNKGLITGGQGTGGNIYATGGAGVAATDGTIMNTGTIQGGQYGYLGGAGVELSAGTTLINHGNILGGSDYAFAGGDGVNVSAGATITNTGLIAAGNATTNYRYEKAQSGAAGVIGAGIDLSNTGTIVGGIANFYYGGADPSGAGVDLTRAGKVSNTGTIIGGAAHQRPFGGVGYLAGAGILLEQGGDLQNAGTIIGGAGGASYLITGVDGAAGVMLSAAGTITNNGTIIGGAGGLSYGAEGGNGGTGVYVTAGTLITSGMIIGGTGGVGITGNGAQGDAVYVDPHGPGPVRIIAQPGLAFHGNVAGNNADVTLELAGRRLGLLIGIGSTITGIPTIVEDAHADWKLLKDSSLAAGVSLSAAGTLELGGAFSGAGTLTLDSGGIVTADHALSVTNVDFASGGHETLVLDAPTSTTSTFSGFAANDKIDLANLVATSASFSAGTLTLLDGSSTVATLLLDGSYTSANFTLTSDGNSGTDIKYVATLSDFAPPTAPSSQHPAAYAWSEPSYLHIAGPAAPDLLFWPDFTHGRL
jgi:hypothetical protein